MLAEWARNFVGIPYEVCDCYQLVRAVYGEVFGIELSDFSYQDAVSRTRRMLEGIVEWEEVEPEEAGPGDVIVQWSGPLPAHLGVYVGREGGRACMLHTDDPPGRSFIQPIRGGRMTYVHLPRDKRGRQAAESAL